MKKFTAFTYITLLLLSLPFLKAVAQTPEIVVNEYFNENDFSQEWTELLVTKNISSMTGYTFTDNQADQVTWQGGVTFKNIPLWQNVREGTIIVIWHRQLPSGVTRDANIADGYIEVSRDDRTIFDEFLQATGSDYNIVAMNISATGDILQIRRTTSSSTSIHALGHKTIPGSQFLTINGFKTNYPGDCPNGSSNAIIPGRNINDYDGAGKSQIVSGGNITRGFPNRNSGILASSNYLFWEELREPEWTTTASLTYQYNSTGITLNWTPLANATAVEGYVILRAKSFPALFSPVDGYIFTKGVPIPLFSGIEVVDIIPATANTYTENFTASFTLACGEFSEYRMYPYRYGKDDQGKDTNPLNARGRSYNETQFAKVTVSRPAFPAPPQVTVLGGGTFFVFCEGQSIALTANPDNAASYQWLKDGAVIPGETNKIFKAVTEGKYAVRAFNAEGCADQSAEVTVVKSSIGAAFTDSVGVCETKLTASPAGNNYKYQWFNQSSDTIAGATESTYFPTQAGTYSVEIRDDAGCIDTSEARPVNVNSADLSFQVNGIPSSSAIDFGTLGECESSKKLILTVSTLSSFPILVTLTAPAGYRADPSSFNLRSQSAQDVAIYFEPTASGNYDKPLKIESECDDISTSISLLASKTLAKVAAVNPSVEYPAGISCEVQTTTQTVQIVNSGTDVVNFLQPVVAAPFTVTAPAFPKSIAPNETLSITVEYTTTPGLSNQILSVPYISAACTSDVKVALIANTIQPSITSVENQIDFKTLAGCTQQKDTTIDITNPTNIALIIPAQQLDPNFSVTQPVAIGAKETKPVQIRFTATTTGQVISNVILKADKCPDVANISLVLKANSSAPSIQSVAPFKTITNCTAPADSILVSITTASPSTIESISAAPAGFSVSGISVGQVIFGEEEFTVFFTPTADGIYDDSLFVKFAGCPVQQKVLLKGKKSTLNFAFKNSTVDFGTVTPNTPPAPQSATLVNIGSDSLTVNPVNPPAPFKTVSTSVALPARIAPNDSVVFIFEYAPVQENADLYQLSSEPCNGVPQLLLKGNAQYPAGTGKALVSVPVLRGAPGAIVEIPITIANEANSFALEKAAIRELSITLTYDPMLLIPESVRTGDAAQGFDAAAISETTPGTAEIVLKSSGGAVLKPGTAAIVRAKVLLSGSATTPIVLSKITPTANSSVVFTQQNGEFTLDDSCSAGRRLGVIGNQFMLMVSGAMPITSEKAEIIFETNTDEMLALELYNSFGQRVITIYHGNARAGRYVNEISVKDLSDGVYHIIMQTGTNSATAKLVILR